MDYKLFIITVIGFILRFWNLWEDPLWVDEAFFALISTQGNITQEFIPAYFIYLTGWDSEFGLRFISALCGVLTIPAIYYSVKNIKLEAALIVAVFPTLVFWSRMARPYSVAGLFLVLAWRKWYYIIPAILTTPIALIGIKIIKQKFYVIAIALASAIFLYSIREDSGRDWDIEQFYLHSRWHYLPILTIILYTTEIKWLRRFSFLR